eukprot:gene6360-8760_t
MFNKSTTRRESMSSRRDSISSLLPNFSSDPDPSVPMTIVSAIRAKIKSAESNRNSMDCFNSDPFSYGAEFQTEQILINRKAKTVRKVYMRNNKYKIGWIVDADISYCMICFKEFGLLTYKHHCRACGMLICNNCSPYITNVPHLDEQGGSRVCVNCFGLKSEVVAPLTRVSSYNHHETDSVVSSSPSISPSASFTTGAVRRRSTKNVFNTINNQSNNNINMDTNITNISSGSSEFSAGNELEVFELMQRPKYEECYRKMREIIPLDIYKSTLPSLISYGLPETIANRIWNNKILWLICMHQDDISKLHLADLRGKYTISGLDIIEMRAIWFNLPNWKHHGVERNSCNSSSIETGKAEWKNGFKAKLDDMVYKESRGKLPTNLERNEAYQGYDHIHIFDAFLPVEPRFHRSASYSTNAILSPMLINQSSILMDNSNINNDISDLDAVYNNNKMVDHSSLKATQNRSNYLKEDESSLADNNNSLIRSGKSSSHKKSYTYNNNNNQSVRESNQKKFTSLLEELKEEDTHSDYDIDELLSDTYYQNNNSNLNKLINNSSIMNEYNNQILIKNTSPIIPSNNNSYNEITFDNSGFQDDSFLSQKSPHKILTNNKYNNNDDHNNKHNDNNNNNINNTNNNSMTITMSHHDISPVQSADTTKSSSSSRSIQINKLSIKSPVRPPNISSNGHLLDNINNDNNTSVIEIDSHQIESYVPFSNQSIYFIEETPVNVTVRGRNFNNETDFINDTPNVHHSYSAIKSPISSSNPASPVRSPVDSMNSDFICIDADESLDIALMAFPILPSINNQSQELASSKHPQNSFNINDNNNDNNTDNIFDEEDDDISDSLYSTPYTERSLYPDFKSVGSNLTINNADNDKNNLNDSIYLTPQSTLSIDSSNNPFIISNKKFPLKINDSLTAFTVNHRFYESMDIDSPPIDRRVSLGSGLLINKKLSGTKNSNNNDNNNNDSNINILTHDSNTRKSFPIPSTAKEQNIQLLIKYISSGRAFKAMAIIHSFHNENKMNNNNQNEELLLLSQNESNLLLLKCISNISLLKEPKETISLLLDLLHADVNINDNYYNNNGMTPLMYAIQQFEKEIIHLLIMQGANIIQYDYNGNNALQIILNNKIDDENDNYYNGEWFLQCFITCGRYQEFINKSNRDQKLLFLSCLIFAGYSSYATSFLSHTPLVISSNDASNLMEKCSGNFANMKDPVETFELLESLGAKI